MWVQIDAELFFTMKIDKYNLFSEIDKFPFSMSNATRTAIRDYICCGKNKFL